MPAARKVASASRRPEPLTQAALHGSAAIRCFGRDRRLLKPAEFQRVLKKGARAGGAYFRVIAVRGEHPQGRLGLAIAKRSLKRAVDRNLAKRVIRESFRHQDAAVLGGLDVVVMANPGVRSASLAALRDDIDRQLNRIRRKCDAS